MWKGTSRGDKKEKGQRKEGCLADPEISHNRIRSHLGRGWRRLRHHQEVEREVNSLSYAIHF